MKIVLAGVNSKFIHSNLAVRYLKSYTKDLNYECTIREFTINDRKEKILEELIGEKPDIIAFSCYIWNVEYVTSIVRLIKLVDSDIEILIGGPEASYESRKFLSENSADFVIEGEGEETYREFIEKKISKGEIEIPVSIKGLYIKKGENIYYGGSRELMDMNDLVFPYEAMDDLHNKIVYYEASRGCPFKCAYCLSSTQQGVRFINIDRVKSELDYFIRKKVELVKFVDRTFNCNHKFAKEIWRYLIAKNTDTVFHFEISGDILTDDEIELLSGAPKGRFQFEVGVQTTNDEILKNIDRFVSFEDIREKVMKVQNLGSINQHLDLIAGLPGEDMHSFRKSFNDVYSTGSDKIQLGFLKLLKGSKMRIEAENWGMVYSPFAPYEILKTSAMSYDEIVRLKRLEEVFEKYYNSGKFAAILKYFTAFYKTPFDFYDAMGTFYYEKGYYNRNISSADYYKVFIEFNNEILKSDTENVNEIVKYDYIMSNRKRWVPDFFERALDKQVEMLVKEKLKKQRSESINNIHIEIFKIDIIKFAKSGVIEKGDHVLVFDASGKCEEINI